MTGAAPVHGGPAAAPGTVGEALARAAARLRAAGVDGARRDARLLLAAALGVAPDRILARPERSLGPGEAARAEGLVARRAAREPVSRILGAREFWGLTFALAPATLDPRPESETLVEAVLERIADRNAPIRILDLGTGTGCLLLALLSELPAARGLGVDLSEGALAAARANAARLGLAARARFERRNWGRGLAGPWQAIVSNPPYIREDEFEALAPEVKRFDPRSALVAGPDGLEAHRTLVPQAARLLAPGGILALEVGAGQAGPVEGLLVSAGLAPVGRIGDLGGVQRCLLATRRQGPDPVGKKVVGNQGNRH